MEVDVQNLKAVNEQLQNRCAALYLQLSSADINLKAAQKQKNALTVLLETEKQKTQGAATLVNEEKEAFLQEKQKLLEELKQQTILVEHLQQKNKKEVNQIEDHSQKFRHVLGNHIEYASKELVLLNRRLQDLKGKLKNAEATKQNLKSEMEKKDKLYEIAAKQKNALKVELKNMDSILQALRKGLQQKKAEVQKLQSSLEKTETVDEATMARLKAEAHNAKQEVAKAHKENNELKAEITSLKGRAVASLAIETELANTKSKMKETSRELDKMQSEKLAFADRIAKFEKETDEISLSVGEIEAVSKKLQSTKALLAESQQKNSELRQKVSALEAARTNIANDQQLRQTREKLDLTELELNNVKAEKRGFIGKIAHFEKKTNELLSFIKNTENVKQNLQDTKRILAASQQKNNELIQKISTLKKDKHIGTGNNELKELKSRLEDAYKEINSLRARDQALGDTKKALAAANESIESVVLNSQEVEKLEAKLHEAEEEIKKGQVERRKLQEKILLLANTCTKARVDLAALHCPYIQQVDKCGSAVPPLLPEGEHTKDNKIYKLNATLRYNVN